MITDEVAERRRQRDRIRKRAAAAAGRIGPMSQHTIALRQIREAERQQWRMAYRYYARWCDRQGIV